MYPSVFTEYLKILVRLMDLCNIPLLWSSSNPIATWRIIYYWSFNVINIFSIISAFRSTGLAGVHSTLALFDALLLPTGGTSAL